MVEVIVSAAILSLLTLIVMTSFVPLSHASSETAIALDMDRVATKLLAQFRRDLRQSGYRDGGDRMYGVKDLGVNTGPTTSLPTGLVPIDSDHSFVLKIREDVDTWSDTLAWGLSGTNVVRLIGGSMQPMAGQVSALTITIPTSDQVCTVSFTLSRINPKDGSTISRVYTDRIEMMNR